MERSKQSLGSTASISKTSDEEGKETRTRNNEGKE